jgi:hypothetical protein
MLKDATAVRRGRDARPRSLTARADAIGEANGAGAAARVRAR